MVSPSSESLPSPNSVTSFGRAGMNTKKKEGSFDPSLDATLQTSEVQPPSIRDEIALRKEEKIRHEAEQLSFQPSLQSRRGKLKTGPVGTTFDRLYDDAVKRQEEEPKMKPRTDQSELTFKPSISPMARSLSVDRRASDLVNKMHKGAGRVVFAETTTHSFQPKISKRASSLDRSSSASDTSERLYAAKDIQKRKLEMKKAEDVLRHAEKCTFSPVVSTKVRASSTIVEPVGKPLSISDRLRQYAEGKKDRLDIVKGLQVGREMEGVTFQPELVSKAKFAVPGLSSNRGRDAAVKVVSGSRFDHLYKDAIKRKTEDPLVRARVDESHLTFKPSISPKARSLSADRRSANLVDHLHNSVGSGRTPVREAAPVEHCSFKPVITKRGSSIERSSSGITDRLYACKEAADDNMIKLKYDSAVREYEACTFAPDISTSAKSSQKTRSVSQSDVSQMEGGENIGAVQRLLDYGEERKRKLFVEKKARAEIDMTNVTFQPKIRKSPSASKETDESSICSNGNQFDRLYSDAIKRKTDDPLIRANVDESHLTFKPCISPLATSFARATFNDINKRSKDAAEKRKTEELERRAAAATFTHKPVITKRAHSLDRSSLDQINQRQKALADKKREDSVKRLTRETPFTPQIPSYKQRTTRSRSCSTESVTPSVSSYSHSSVGGSSFNSPTSASISGRFNRDPSSVAKARVEEERRARAERDLAAARLTIAKAEREFILVNKQPPVKTPSPLKSSPASSPSSPSATVIRLMEMKTATPIKGGMSPLSQQGSPSLSSLSPRTKSPLDNKVSPRVGMPYGRNV